MAKIQFESTITSYKRHVDKTVSVTARSNYPITPAELTEIDKVYGELAWTLIAPNELDEADIPTEPAHTEGGKTKLQRLKGAYFIYWRDKTDQSEPFNTYWDRQFEKLMDQIKSKLD